MRRLLCLVLFLLAATCLHAEVAVAPVPDWVEPVDLPTMPDALYRDVQDGQAFRLLDRQVRWQDGRRLTYIRIATEAVNRAGLERVASVVRDYDPEIETLTLLRLDIIRDGRRIELAGKARPTILRREERLDAGIIDGTLTAHYDVPGVQVGDVVDAAFLWDGGSYLPDMNREVSLDMEFDVPVAETRLIVHWPQGVPSFVQAPPELLVSLADEPGGKRMEWRRGPLPPEEREPATADLDDRYDSVRISPHTDWEEVSAPLTDYYTRARPVPAAWAQRVEQIRKDGNTPTARAHAALWLVQDEIRYVGLEVGAGGFFARDPDVVVEQGFGDCKDKALLLKTILQGLGIEAEVALASTRNGHDLAQALPAATAFNHMITGAKLRGRWVWMDPTQSYQGGIGLNATPPDLGFVLPVTAGEDRLVKIETRGKPQIDRSEYETFSFTDDGMLVDVETRYFADSAAYIRKRFDTMPLSEIASAYLDYYRSLYPGIRQVAEPALDDSRVYNRVTVTEHYKIERDDLQAEGLWHHFPFVSDLDLGAFPKPGPRTAPLAVPHHTRLLHSVVLQDAPFPVRLPDGMKLDNPAFALELTAQRSRNRVWITWSYETRTDEVSAETAQTVLKDAETARSATQITFDFGNLPGQGNWLEKLLRNMARQAESHAENHPVP